LDGVLRRGGIPLGRQNIILADFFDIHVEGTRCSNYAGCRGVVEADFRNPILHQVLVGRSGDLFGIVEEGLLDRGLADLLEGRDRHGGQETDDDDDDHDFDEGEALLGTFHNWVFLNFG